MAFPSNSTQSWKFDIMWCSCFLVAGWEWGRGENRGLNSFLSHIHTFCPIRLDSLLALCIFAYRPCLPRACRSDIDLTLKSKLKRKANLSAMGRLAFWLCLYDSMHDKSTNIFQSLYSFHRKVYKLKIFKMLLNNLITFRYNLQMIPIHL